jgi:hypothetical protein
MTQITQAEAVAIVHAAKVANDNRVNERDSILVEIMNRRISDARWMIRQGSYDRAIEQVSLKDAMDEDRRGN